MTPYEEDMVFQEDAPNSLRFWNPRGGGGTLGISGMCRWDPGILTRGSSAEFCYPTLEVNSPNPRYPKVAVFQKLLRSLAQSSQNKTLYHNPWSR